MTRSRRIGGRVTARRWTAAAATLLAASLIAIVVLLGDREGAAAVRRETPLGWPAAGANAERATEVVGPVAHDFRLRLDSLKDAVAAAPGDTDARLALARTLQDAHRLPEAILHYEILVDGNSEATAVHLDLAQAHAQLGHWDRAAAIMERLLDGDPENAAVLYNLGAIAANRGDAEAAKGWWNRMLDLDGESIFDERARTSLRQLEHGLRDRS